MNIVLSIKNKESLYEQIKSQIIQAILSDELKENEQLPSIRVLAKELTVGIITVKRAYDDLVTENILISKEAKGYYVNEKSIDHLTKLFIEKIKQDIINIKKEASLYHISKASLNKLWEETSDV